MTELDKVIAFIKGDIHSKQELYRQLEVSTGGSGEKILRILREGYIDDELEVYRK